MPLQCTLAAYFLLPNPSQFSSKFFFPSYAYSLPSSYFLHKTLYSYHQPILPSSHSFFTTTSTICPLPKPLISYQTTPLSLPSFYPASSTLDLPVLHSWKRTTCPQQPPIPTLICADNCSFLHPLYPLSTSVLLHIPCRSRLKLPDHPSSIYFHLPIHFAHPCHPSNPN